MSTLESDGGSQPGADDPLSVEAPTASESLSQKRIFNTWWPLAAGWLLMTVETPMLAAFVARLPNPEINLAAWGVSFPIVLLFGSPALALLATSTTFSKEWDSYRRLRRFALILLGLLAGLQAMVAFTPLYDVVANQILGVPEELFEPARTGLRIMVPFVAAVGIRRLNNGVLIRFGYSRAVTLSAVTRLLVDAVVIGVFQFLPEVSGIVFASVTFTAGVCGEAVYSFWRVQPVLRNQLREAPPPEEPLTLSPLLQFYTPLVMTILIQVLIQPIVAAALSRLPNPIPSLAVWPIIISVISILTSSAHAYVEAVVVVLDEPKPLRSLYRFTAIMGATLLGLLFLFNLTPLSGLWFRDVQALPENLVAIARQSMWIMSLGPAFAVLDAMSSGMLMSGRKTRHITESVLMSLAFSILLMIIGIFIGQWSGLTVCLFALVIGGFLRSGWLWRSARPVRQSIWVRDSVGGAA